MENGFLYLYCESEIEICGSKGISGPINECEVDAKMSVHASPLNQVGDGYGFFSKILRI